MEIYRIEAGTRIVSDLEMLALAQALECRPMWLFLGEMAEGGKTVHG